MIQLMVATSTQAKLNLRTAIYLMAELAKKIVETITGEVQLNNRAILITRNLINPTSSTMIIKVL